MNRSLSSTRIARILGRLLSLIVLVSSGTYFLVYLYRWEWNRALISGLIFVAAELATLASLLLARVGALERRIEHLGVSKPTSPPIAVDAVQGGANRYRWLDSSAVGVFIPVLMGAGAVLAALAYVVERLAAFVVGPEKSEPRYLDHIAYPTYGLTGANAPPDLASLDSAMSRSRPRTANTATKAIIAILAVLMVITVVNVIAENTQSRPEPLSVDGRSDITVDIGYRAGDESTPEDTAHALFESCRLTLPGDARVSAGPALVQGRSVVVTIEPRLGRLGVRRLRGCLEDATLDGVKARVVSVKHA